MLDLSQPPVLWVLLVIAAAILIGFVCSLPKKASFGFKDVVKDPGYWGHAERSFREAEEAVEEAAGWTDAQVEEAVTKFLFHTTSSRDAWREQKILRSLGARTHQITLGYLADKGRYALWVKPTGMDILPEAPFHRGCDLLGDTPPLTAVPLLAPFLADPDKSIRQQAALAIAKTGSTEMVPLIRRALADAEEYVRSYALMGLQWSIKTKSLEPGVAGQLFTDVRHLVEAGKNSDKSAELLFDLDAPAATEVFLSPAFFNASSNILHKALGAMGNAGAMVPAELLSALITELLESDLAYPRDYTLGQALRLLGRHHRPADLAMLMTLSSHREREVARGASLGLLAHHELEGFDTRISKLEQEHGYDALSRPQQFCIAVSRFDTEVRNGGLDQYFVNSSGDLWRDALEGMKAMEFMEAATVLEKAAAKFGSGGPSTNRNQRQEQLARLARKSKDAFGKLEREYYNIQEPVEVVMDRYAIANPNDFK